jgi:nitroimidazol reductase NimA-like FMN-containing flavoprotein (pyridoxamine 5'-phosphate oxidase superfamily)
MKSREFFKSQKILRLATISPSGSPHIVPVWYRYTNGKFYVGTNTRTEKAKNIKNNSRVSFCIDTGIRSPDIFGVMGVGRARLIVKPNRVQHLAEKILLRYFASMKNQSAQKLLEQTDCIIEIIPKKTRTWKY